MIYALLVHILTKICQNIDNLDVYHAWFLGDFTPALICFLHFQFTFWPKIAQNIEWLGVFYLCIYSICALLIHNLRQNATKYWIIRGILPPILYNSCTFIAHFPPTSSNYWICRCILPLFLNDLFTFSGLFELIWLKIPKFWKYFTYLFQEYLMFVS